VRNNRTCSAKLNHICRDWGSSSRNTVHKSLPSLNLVERSPTLFITDADQSHSAATETRTRLHSTHAPLIGMEVAIRWSPLSTPSDCRFLLVDVSGRTFKHCQIIAHKDAALEWQEISRYTKAPAFRAFDWLPSQDVVAVGQASGETNLLHLSSGTQVLSLPIKSQRQCNAVAFSSEGLLATGLERVRNDFCLNVHDVHQRLAKQPNILTPKSVIEPIRRLATSEGITSIKFFPQQPNTLIAGVKGTCLRIYDLRDSASGPSRQFQTSCVHNIAIDPTDENYFASAGSLKDNTVLVWDRRSTVRPILKKNDKPTTHEGPLLEIRPLAGRERADQHSIWSLRFSRTEPGCLGIISSSGYFWFYKTKKEHVSDQRPVSKGSSEVNDSQDHLQYLYIKNVLTVERPMPQRRLSSTQRERESPSAIVSFEFANVLALSKQPCVITLRRNQDVGIYEIKRPTTALAVSSRNAMATSISCRRSSVDGNLPGSPFGLVLRQPGHSKQNKKSVSEALHHLQTGSGRAGDMTTPGLDATLLAANESRDRAVKGYLLDCKKNARIVENHSDAREMWEWISRR
jgi:WD40 repeat protein